MDRIATSIYYIECVYVVLSVHKFSKRKLGDCDIFCDMESFKVFEKLSLQK